MDAGETIAAFSLSADSVDHTFKLGRAEHIS
jgi:hypothetical protein